jgi:hypothetical protein
LLREEQLDSPQAHARVSGELMRGSMELQESERHIFSSQSDLVWKTKDGLSKFYD